MSEENVEIIRRFSQSWNEHGVAGIEPFLHARIEWIDPPELPGGGVHRGREATMEFLREWQGAVVALHFELDEILECPGGYLAVSTAQGQGEGGAPIPSHQWFHLIELLEEKIVRAQLFLSRVPALKAAGLSQ